MKERTNILLIEDNPDDQILLSATLEDTSIGADNLRVCTTLKEGLMQLQMNGVDVVLLDRTLPDSTGVKGLQKIRNEFARLPVIMLTGLNDDEAALESINSGAQDYLVKGQYSSLELERSIRYALERSNAAEFLARSEQRSRNILAAIPDPMFTVSGDGYYLDCTIPDYCRPIYPEDELIGAHKKDILPPDVAEQHLKCIAEALVDDVISECSYTLMEQGNIRYYEARFTRIEDNKVLQVVRDNTQSHLAQKEIINREHQLRMITENINEVVYQLTYSEGGVEVDYVSPKVIDVLGYSVSDYIKLNPTMAESLRPGDLERGAAFNKKVRSAKKQELFLSTYEFYNPIRKEWIWVEEKTVPYFDQNGKVIGQFGTVGDVTERVNHQRQLEEYAKNLELQHDEALRSQSMLLSTQINPHFIFNALNSVQYYILNQEIEPAINFVSEFSTLMRAVLTNSMHLFIPLGDELNLLKAYLDLESLRFNDKFSYEIEVDEEVEEANALIPPMLLQPYLENAIIHGIGPLEKKGQVKLHFKKRHDLLVCIVEDNGVGREKAAGYQRLREGDKPKSYGMGITSKKIELLNQITDGGFAIRVTDLYNEDESPAGTRVTVVVPWKES